MDSTPISIAAKEIGTVEQPKNSNNVKYNTWFYGRKVSGAAYPWCMAAVQYWFDKSGHKLPYKTASCSALLNWYKSKLPGRIVKEPKPNDIVIYTFGHTGIVESANGKTITAIEGNTSSDDRGDQANGGGVFRRKRDKTLVTAYIRPYDFEEDENMTGEEIYNKLDEYCKGQKLPKWAEKELKEAVAMGITDGKNPCALIPRYQAAIMALRAVKGK